MEVPKKIKDAFATTSAMMLASLGIPQSNLDGAAAAYWDEIEGRGIHSITEQRPLDRVRTRKQAAELLSRSKKTISAMCANGTLRGVYGGKDGKRLTGVTESSLRAFMSGTK